MADGDKTIRERLAEEVSEGFEKSTGVIVNNTREVLGDALGSLIDDIQNLTGGLLNVVQGTLSTIGGALFGRTEEKTLDENREQTTLLSQMLDLFERGEKREMREIDGGGGGLLDAVITMLGAVTGIIAGYLVTALGPFKSLSIVLKPFLKDGFVFKLFSETLPRKFTLLQRVGTRISAVISRISGIFSGIVKALSESGAFKFGVVVGKMLFWFRFLFDSIKTIFSDMSIRDKILGVSAKLLSLIAEIPQWITNGLLALFGSEFRVDFGKDAIIDAVNRFSDWLFPNFTVPVLDFFTIDIPNFFKRVVDNIRSGILKIKELPELIGEKIKNMFNFLNPANLFGDDTVAAGQEAIQNVLSKVTDLPSKINDWLKGKLEGIISKIPDFLLPESLENFKFDRSEQPANDNLNVNRQLPPDMPLTGSRDNNEKKLDALTMETKRTNGLLEKLVKSNEKNGQAIQQTNTTIVSQQNNTTNGKNIPSQNEDVGLNLLNGAMQ